MSTNTVLSKFLQALADELARLDYRAGELLTEKNTLTTDELLSDHERDFDIPNDCDELAATDANRRTMINVKLKLVGKHNASYYENIATDLDHTILIFEHTEEEAFICGESVCGDSIGDRKMSYYWSVAIYYNHSMADTTTGDVPFLASLICAIKKHRPAQTFVLFDYYGPGFSNGFGFGFDSRPPEATKATWEGGFAHAGFSSGFDRYHGVTWPAYRGGGFTKGFNLTGFNVFPGIDLNPYFVGGFTRGFSSGFNINKNV